MIPSAQPFSTAKVAISMIYLQIQYDLYQISFSILNYCMIEKFRKLNFQVHFDNYHYNFDMDPEQNISEAITLEPKKEHIHTLIWIHGLKELAEEHKKFFDFEDFDNFKIILPQAPISYVTVGKNNYTSWYDIKFRGQTSFIVPFDEAFSSQEVHQNTQKILKPIIKCARNELNQKAKNGKLIIGGFSQGCGMALHCFFQEPERIDAVLGISGYLFPFSKYNSTDKRMLRVLYGKADVLRPWEYVKIVYDGKINQQNGKLILVDETGHQVNEQMQKNMKEFIHEVIKN